MESDEMLAAMSVCFASVERDEWKQLTAQPVWSGFLDAARRALQDDDVFGEPTSPISRARKRCPLQEFLSAGEVRALFAPPTYDEKRAFEARHFTGGLTDSALPVESLYATWSHGTLPSPFSRCAGMYQGDSARYMKDLVERMGMGVPSQFAACPDHLALELDLAAVLLRSGARDAARQFLAERLAWLTAYRMRLLKLGPSAGFYIGLVDVLLGIRTQLASEAEAAGARAGCESRTGHEANAGAEVVPLPNTNRSHACI
ncbi:nitrate reductase delta subunit [Gordonibacter sp. An230]|nr:nitrate reductase delta subunit [Gordonibacter sp. An230]